MDSPGNGKGNAKYIIADVFISLLGQGVIENSMRHIVEKCLSEHLNLKKTDLDAMIEFYSNGL
ncbi:MAG: hypothetical protein LIO86_05220 [Lachnospiraceae bacterium]|nr:hypothetical protein [Lachnospiraceae bacterium]